MIKGSEHLTAEVVTTESDRIHENGLAWSSTEERDRRP